jgi:hypothetical protein
MEVTDSRAFLQRHHLHNISVSISSPESDSELRAISSAIAHFERLQETTSQCALTLCHAVFPVLLFCFRLRLNVREARSSVSIRGWGNIMVTYLRNYPTWCIRLHNY